MQDKIIALITSEIYKKSLTIVPSPHTSRVLNNSLSKELVQHLVQYPGAVFLIWIS